MTNCSAITHNLFSFTLLSKNASANRLESHTNKKACIYIKTMGFKPFRDTYLHGTISQSLLNHILTKNRDGVGGWGPTEFRISRFEFRFSSLPSPFAGLKRI